MSLEPVSLLVFPALPYVIGNGISESKSYEVSHAFLTPVRQIAVVNPNGLVFVERHKWRTHEVWHGQPERNKFRSTLYASGCRENVERSLFRSTTSRRAGAVEVLDWGGVAPGDLVAGQAEEG